jgi:hypothetical protein
VQLLDLNTPKTPPANILTANIPLQPALPALLLHHPISHIRPTRSNIEVFDLSKSIKTRKVQLIDRAEEDGDGRVYVNVVVRVRPLLPFELKRGEEQIVEVVDGFNVKVSLFYCSQLI